MKNALLLTGLLFSTTLFAADTDSTGLEGDNLDLNAVMQIFKESDSPEDFEQKLNTESTDVNNLDLDEDGEVDYIRVVDTGDSISHVLTLQVDVNENESQDVAVIEMEETGKDSINLHVLGDEELYGEDYILEPQSNATSKTVVNVYAWRPIRHMWGPRYVFWASPYRYRNHPNWYRPWKRRGWNVYHGRVIRHHGHCRRVTVRRFNHGHTHHYHRTHSATFHNHHHHKHTNKVAGPNNGGKKAATTKPAGAKSKTTPAKTQSAKKTATSPSQKKANSTQKKQETNSRKRPGRTSDSKKSSNTRKRPGSTSGKKKRN